MSKPAQLLYSLVRQSTRIAENLSGRVRLLAKATSSSFSSFSLRALPAVNLNDFSLKRLFPINRSSSGLISVSNMDLVKQINANHQSLVDRISALELLVLQQNGGDLLVSNVPLSPPTESEIEAERLRLTAENAELRKQVDSLVRQLTAIEIAVKGKDQVAGLDLLSCSKSAAPAPPAAVPESEAPAKSTPPSTTSASAAPTAANNKENQAPKQQQEKKQKQPKQPKAEGGEQKKAPAKQQQPAEPENIDASRLDLRVGRILEVSKHPDADSLYVEKIDCGEPNPRTVVSGLVKFVPIEQMQNRLVVTLCNLKPAKMRGVLSEAMVMCASTPEKVEVLSPPEGAVPGDRVTFEKFPGVPDTQLNPKKKIWEQIAPDLSTNDSLLATYKGDPFVVAGKGPVKAETLKNVVVK